MTHSNLCVIYNNGTDPTSSIYYCKCVDLVNNPPHYTKGKIEVLDFIEDQDFGYLDGQVIKYISRYRHKNGLEDLKKAEFYLRRLIKITETK